MRGLKRCAEAAELDVCGICLTRPPDTVMVPCFCLSACKACWDRWVRTRLEREGRRQVFANRHFVFADLHFEIFT